MISVITAIWTFFLDNFWSIVGIVAVLLYGKTFHQKYIFTPLAGGNGKIQADELAKGVIIAIMIWSVNRDGYRQHEWTYFSDAYYAALIAGLFAIAAIKPVASVLNARKFDQPKQQDQSHDVIKTPEKEVIDLSKEP